MIIVFELKDYITKEKVRADSKDEFLRALLTLDLSEDDDLRFWQTTAYEWIRRVVKNDVPDGAGALFRVNPYNVKAIREFVKNSEKRVTPFSRVSAGWFAVKTGNYPVLQKLSSIHLATVTMIGNGFADGYISNTGYTGNFVISNVEGEMLFAYDMTMKYDVNNIIEEAIKSELKQKFIVVERVSRDKEKIIIGNILPTKVDTRLIVLGRALSQHSPDESDFKLLKIATKKAIIPAQLIKKRNE